MSLPPNGSVVRARVRDWARCQANNQLEYPDPRLPSYEGIPEWIEGPFRAETLAVWWGELELIAVEWDGCPIGVEYDTIEILTLRPQGRTHRRPRQGLK